MSSRPSSRLSRQTPPQPVTRDSICTKPSSQDSNKPTGDSEIGSAAPSLPSFFGESLGNASMTHAPPSATHSRASLNSGHWGDYPEVVPADVFAGPQAVTGIAHSGSNLIDFIFRKPSRTVSHDGPIPIHTEKTYLRGNVKYMTGLGITKRRFWSIFLAGVIVIGVVICIAVGVTVRKKQSSAKQSPNNTKALDSWLNATALGDSDSTSPFLFSQNVNGDITQWLRPLDSSMLKNNKTLLSAAPNSPVTTVTYDNHLTIFYYNATTSGASYKTYDLSTSAPLQQSSPLSTISTVDKLPPANAAHLVAATTPDNATLHLIFQSTNQSKQVFHDYISSTKSLSTSSPTWKITEISPEIDAISNSPLSLLQNPESEELRLYYQATNLSVIEIRRSSNGNWKTGTIYPTVPSGGPFSVVSWKNYTQTRVFSTYNETSFSMSYYDSATDDKPNWKTIPGGTGSGGDNGGLVGTVQTKFTGEAKTLELYYIRKDGEEKEIWIDVWTSDSGVWDGGKKATG